MRLHVHSANNRLQNCKEIITMESIESVTAVLQGCTTRHWFRIGQVRSGQREMGRGREGQWDGRKGEERRGSVRRAEPTVKSQIEGREGRRGGGSGSRSRARRGGSSVVPSAAQ